MYLQKLNLWALLVLVFAGSMSITSCSDDDGNAPPMVTLTSDAFEGETGETASTTVDASMDGEFKELRITKFLGTTIDDTYGTGGTLTVTSALPYTLDYELNEEGADTPVRFRFVVEDMEGLTGEANFVITTELTLSYVLTNYDWQWTSKIGKVFDTDPESEMIEECEEDNVYTFNADGTMSLDYGTLTGSGGGTCDFDGLNPYVSYTLNNDETILTLTQDDIFNPGTLTSTEYTLVDFSITNMTFTSEVDLTAFGGIVYDWTFGFKAIPK